MRTRKPTVLNPAWTDQYKALWLSLPRCRSCGRRLRPMGKALAVYPGTVSSPAVGVCASCWRNPVEPQYAPAPEPAPEPGFRAVLSAAWTAEEWAVARLVAARCGVEGTAEVLELLGLFDPVAARERSPGLVALLAGKV